MRGPKPDPLNLSESDQHDLERLVCRHSTSQQIALRGRIILEANAGKNNSQIARELSVSVETVRAWRKRWLALQGIKREDLSVAERLSDVPRRAVRRRSPPSRPASSWRWL